jgi:hypothetical protein
MSSSIATLSVTGSYWARENLKIRKDDKDEVELV